MFENYKVVMIGGYMYIGTTKVSKNGRPYFIADIASNHDGSLERAFKLIELAKEAGADAAKFQNFKARTIVSKHGFDTMPQISHQAEWKKSVYEIYEEASIKDEWTIKLKEKCDLFDIEYMTSPYDFDSVDHAEKFVNAYKIGSGDITWTEIIEYIAQKGKPILLATGASTSNDVDRAVHCLEKYTKNIVLMQCNTNYTVDYNNFSYINLNVLKTYQKQYPNCILGLSDHTQGHTTVLGALALGARVFEKHFTDDNTREGPDHRFAMNPKTWKEMVDASMQLFNALGDGVKKIEQNEIDSVIVQQRAIYTKAPLKKGHILTKDDVFPLRPLKDGCIYPYEINKIIGKKLNRDIKQDECLKWENIGHD